MLWLKLFHLLCFVYWLGADIGTYYASRFVADGRLAPPQRATAAKIMLAVDLAPRVCMPLTLASGVHLASIAAGLALPVGALAAVWAGCLAWLAVALWLHHAAPGAGRESVVRGDFAFRALLAAALLAVALGITPRWLAVKLGCFALTVLCGLMIRVHLRAFGPAFGALLSQGATAQGDAAIAASIARCKPWVWAIWALLLVAAASGLHAI